MLVKSRLLSVNLIHYQLFNYFETDSRRTLDRQHYCTVLTIVNSLKIRKLIEIIRTSQKIIISTVIINTKIEKYDERSGVLRGRDFIEIMRMQQIVHALSCNKFSFAKHQFRLKHALNISKIISIMSRIITFMVIIDPLYNYYMFT